MLIRLVCGVDNNLEMTRHKNGRKAGTACSRRNFPSSENRKERWSRAESSRLSEDSRLVGFPSVASYLLRFFSLLFYCRASCISKEVKRNTFLRCALCRRHGYPFRSAQSNRRDFPGMCLESYWATLARVRDLTWPRSYISDVKSSSALRKIIYNRWQKRTTFQSN